jgi:hypothetical protein
MIRTFAMKGLLCLAAGIAAGRSFVGNWQVTLGGSWSELRIVLNIKPGFDSVPTARLENRGQGANGIPVTLITFENTKLILRIDSINDRLAKGDRNGDRRDLVGGIGLELKFMRVPRA